MEEKSKVMAVEELKAQKAKSAADEIAAECDKEVEKAMPIKARAERALNSL